MKIVNIVATAKVKGEFNLALLSEKISGVEYSPNKMWLKMRLQPGNYYIAFYKSGKFLITGVTDFNLLIRLLEEF